MKKVTLLADGGPGVGYGHLARSTLLGHELLRRDIQVRLVTEPGASTSPQLRSWQRDTTFLATSHDTFWYEILDDQPDWLVIDSYRIRKDQVESSCQEEVRTLVFWDHESPPPAADLVVDASPARLIAEPAKKHCLYGPKFALLPVETSSSDRVVANTVNQVLVTFGGTDQSHLLPDVLEYVRRSFPLAQVEIAAAGWVKLAEKVVDSDHETIVLHGPLPSLEPLIATSDLAICAAGQTSFQLARAGVPGILIALADNQRPNHAGWIKSGVFLDGGNWTEGITREKLETALNQIQEKGVREDLSARGKELVDGKGAERIVDAMMEVEQDG